MARFNDIHRSAMHAADRRLHRGEIWNVAIREPLQFVGLDMGAVDSFTVVVAFRINERGALEPAGTKDREIIADWEKRHRDTPDDRFGLPEELWNAARRK